ncbi:MAG: FAD-dependent oxidoreductase [Lautropia sp.]
MRGCEDWDLETEFLIIGAGGCGLMAAFAAARTGVEVTLIEKNATLQCNTELASGSIPAAGTRFQSALGIDGTPEQMAEDIMRKNGGRADAAIVHMLCRRSRDLIDLIVDEVGLPLELNTDAGRVGHSFLRLHNPPGRSGAPLVRALHTALSRFPNFTFADRTPGTGLITDEHRSVIGATAGEGDAMRIRAGKVLLACDGFGANRRMLERYIPEMAHAEYIGAQGNTGDGIQWGMALGAATDHLSGHQGHGYVCAKYGTRLSPEIPLLGGIVVDAQAQRFVREDQGYSEFAGVVLAQPGGVAIEIFDQRIHDILAPTAHFRETVEAGALRRGDTAEALALALRLDPTRLRATIDAYNDAVAAGVDPLGRAQLGPALGSPLYGAYITGALAHTQGGLRVDLDARVLRPDGSIIGNLYAGGGTAAGISGDGPDGYLSGNGLLSALGLGLVAGEHASAALLAQRVAR